MRRWVRPVLILALLVAGVVGARALGLGDLIRLENVARLKQWIEGFGALAPVVFIVGYVLAVVFFVPGLPITVLGGVAFGPVWGTLYVWIAATIGAALSFLVARYAVRSTVERWVRASPRLARLDELAAEHGWRIVMLTRLVPVFPAELRLRTDPYRLLALRYCLVHLHAARHGGLHLRGRRPVRGPRRRQAHARLSRGGGGAARTRLAHPALAAAAKPRRGRSPEGGRHGRAPRCPRARGQRVGGAGRRRGVRQAVEGSRPARHGERDHAPPRGLSRREGRSRLCPGPRRARRDEAGRAHERRRAIRAVGQCL